MRDPFDRMMERVHTVPESGCWLYAGSVDGGGYGTVSSERGKAPHKAHRLSFEKHHGPLLDGEQACHKCDTPPCVNPEHLFRGSAKDNALDCQRKGRRNPASARNLRPGAKGYRGAGPRNSEV